MKKFLIASILIIIVGVGTLWVQAIPPTPPASPSTNAETIQGVAIDAPVVGDDGKYIVYDHSGPKFDYGSPAGGGDMLIAVWDGDADGFIDADAGGTDIDTSASTGVPSIAAGTWSVGATLKHELGGLEADVAAYDGLVHITGGATSAKAVSANGLSLIAAANYAAMRTLMDLEAGTDFYSVAAADLAFQPLDADLTSIAALGTAADRYLYTTAPDTWAEGTITTAGRAILDDADADAQRTTLGVAIGSNVQAYNADLAAIAAGTWTGAQPASAYQRRRMPRR
jgi:hypothetical protein